MIEVMLTGKSWKAAYSVVTIRRYQVLDTQRGGLIVAAQVKQCGRERGVSVASPKQALRAARSPRRCHLQERLSLFRTDGLFEAPW